MLVSTFLTKVNYALRGTDDDAPSYGSEEATYWVSLLNTKISEVAYDITKSWDFLFSETTPNEPGTVATAGTTALTGTDTYFTDYKVGDKITVSGETERTIATIVSDTSLTVTVAFSNTSSGLTFTHKHIIASGVQTYNLHRRFLAASDQAYVIKTDTNRVYFDFISPQERSTLNQNIFISELNPKSLTFTSEIESTNSIVGGELVLPAYYLPVELDAATDEIPLPDPNWGVTAVAAEIAFADITYEDRASTLNDKANYLYNLMVKNNRRGTYKNPRITPTVVKRIRGY